MLTIRRPIGTIGIMGGVMSVPMDFAWSLAQMVQYNTESMVRPDEYVHLIKADTSYHAAARNRMSYMFEGDWLLMLDTDHSFDPDLCSRMVGLIKKWDVDVLTAVYRYKVHPYLPNLFRWNEETQGYVTIAQLDWNTPLTQVDCFGGGCSLVRRSVFEAIRKTGEEPFEIMPSPDGKRMYSEDFSFCTRLRKLGIKAYVSPFIESAHLRIHPVTHKDFDPSSVPMVPA
jgi:GT2 family glycosyltransferase